MKLDAKQKVLLAIYMEYQKDIPNIKGNINHETVGLDIDIFNNAVDKLENEHMISGSVSKRLNDRICMVWIDNTKITNYGISYIEEKLGVDSTLTGEEKLEYISEVMPSLE